VLIFECRLPIACCVCLQSLPTVNGFLDAAIAALPGWRKILPNYPVVSWLSFVEYIRATVNSLASDGHIRELVCQLQLVGEVLMLYMLLQYNTIGG